MEDDLIIEHPENLHWFLDKDNLTALNKQLTFDCINLHTVFDIGFGFSYRLASFLARFFPSVNLVNWFSQPGKIKIAEGIFLSKSSCVFWTTRAYIINRKACEILLQEGRARPRAVDALAACCELYGLRQYYLNPLPVDINENISSEIGVTGRLYARGEATLPQSISITAERLYKTALFLAVKTGLMRFDNILKKAYLPSSPATHRGAGNSAPHPDEGIDQGPLKT